MNDRTLWGLALAAALMHGLWALTIGYPEDMDAQYYLLVAQSLASGEGAMASSLWNLSVLPAELPAPADVHWMPLQSRILAPFVWAWPAGGAALAQVLLAATWAPLAAWLARDLGASERIAILAGLLTASGGVYARVLSMPDCYGLYGLIGTVGLYAVARQRLGLVALMALLAALTRNDGFVYGLCLAAALSGGARVLVGGAGLAGTGLWALRNHLVAGEQFWSARRLAADASTYLDIFDGVSRAPLGAVDHLLGPVTHAASLGEYLLTPGLLLLTPFTWWGIWVNRERPWVRALALLVFAVPVVSLMLAPTVSDHGTLYRSAAATFPAQMALAAVMLHRTGLWAAQRRGYSDHFVPGIFGASFIFIALGMGALRFVEPKMPSECAAVAFLPDDEVVFTSRPLELEVRCGRPGVMITRGGDPERLREAARRYDIRHVVAAPGIYDEGSISVADIPRLLPGWIDLGNGVFERP